MRGQRKGPADQPQGLPTWELRALRDIEQLTCRILKKKTFIFPHVFLSLSEFQFYPLG
jgi:hypothetical protein